MNDILLILIMLVSAVYVAQPYWHPAVAARSPRGNNLLGELIEKRDELLAALKEIEFDHATGKMADDDFAEMNERYRNEAVTVLKRIDALGGGNGASKKLEKDLAKLRSKRSRKKTTFCASCGRPVYSDDQFCSGCGSKLKA